MRRGAVAMAVAVLVAGGSWAGAPVPELLLRAGFDRPEDAQIRRLSDEFGQPVTLGNWRRIWRDEHWPADQLEQLDIGSTRPGWISMLPYTSSWYMDYRGELSYTQVAGDFVASTRVDTFNRAGSGPPGSLAGGPPDSEYSLAGILVRAPRADVVCCDPSWWQPGGERYVFLSFGSANLTGAWQIETKSTRAAIPPEVNSMSSLEIGPASPGPVELRVARIGPYLILLVREPGQAWRVQRRLQRNDFPATLQVGLTVYTDWAIASTWPYAQHNASVITSAWQSPGTPAQPDLLAQFDYLRFERPLVPAPLVGANLADPAAVSDAQLLAFLAPPP